MQRSSDLSVNLDHLVIAAADLKSGVDYVKQTLGVDIPYGGEHPQMGTHNHLMRLGDQVFLEVIAINPDAEQSDCPRWYGLDDPYLRESITQQPRLIGWVANTNNISETLSRTEFDFGRPKLISRGDLNWYFCLPEDGHLLAGGFIPYLMKWNVEIHPAINMTDLGCGLQDLKIYHPHSEWLKSILREIGASDLVTTHSLANNQTAYMTALISTPTGSRQLTSNVKMDCS